ncbi:uncharacterized protein I303_103706 [Kwoniella dejecticola CBS 10117]|uniref:Uncharacterized protein n=1 Tax=Kwoniella dejecticola CBS 10117 TaxID=1296121 RepID=A0A1A6A7H5_9TREE|nr:uncharacterized protein I303_03722 [Kwoniella dejecticola CBS 10117]OBR86006.1 hypothetical protein I303_03722 [Kwoniella dejecticola CBS 10117]
MSNYYNSSPTIHNLIQNRANAISSIPFSQTTSTFIDSSVAYQSTPPRGVFTDQKTEIASPSPLLPPRHTNMNMKYSMDNSPTASSPSLYSKTGHGNSQLSPRVQMITSRKLRILSESDMNTNTTSYDPAHRGRGQARYSRITDHHNDNSDINCSDDDEEDEDEEDDTEEEDPRRMSMVGGPKVRKYTQVPWEEDQSINDAPWSAVSGARQRLTSNISRAGSAQGVAGATVVGSADMFSGFSRHANKMINAVVSQSTTTSASTSTGTGTNAGAGSSGSRSRSKSRQRQTDTRTKPTSTGSSAMLRMDQETSLPSTATSTNTRRNLAQILGVSVSPSPSPSPSPTMVHSKHLVPSNSGLSLSSNPISISSSASTASSSSSTISDDRSQPITPKLRANETTFASSRPSPKIDSSPTISFDLTKTRGQETSIHRSGSTTSSTYHEDPHSKTGGLLPAVVPKSTMHGTYKTPISPRVDHAGVASDMMAADLTPSTKDKLLVNDRPLMSSGSPGFGLITLEAAQERERLKYRTQHQPGPDLSQSHDRFVSSGMASHQTQIQRPVTTFSIPPIPDDIPASINRLRPTTSCTSSGTSASSRPSSNGSGNGSGSGNKVKSKKSGIMRLFNKSDKASVPPLPGTTTPSAATSKRDMGRSSIWSTHDSSSHSGAGSENAVWPPPSSVKSSASVKKLILTNRMADQHGQYHPDPLSADVGAGHGEKEQTQTQAQLQLQLQVKPKLELRPISMNFSSRLPVDYMVTSSGKPSIPRIPGSSASSDCCDDLEQEDIDSILLLKTPSTPMPTPTSQESILRKSSIKSTNTGDPTSSITNNLSSASMEEQLRLQNKRIREQWLNNKKIWKIKESELESQIRELKDQLIELKSSKPRIENGRGSAGICERCGCSCSRRYIEATEGAGDGDGDGLLNPNGNGNGNGNGRKVIDRARVKTAGARGVFGSGSLYEWE